VNDHLVNLNDGAPIDPAGVLRGAWQGFVLQRVAAGARHRLDADGVEHLVYVVAGSGTASATAGGEPVRFAEGTAFTIVRGDGVRFEADEPVELFVATLRA
jgi:hypothetical protein